MKKINVKKVLGNTSLILGIMILSFVFILTIIFNTLITTDYLERTVTTSIPRILYLIYPTVFIGITLIYPLLKKISNRTVVIVCLSLFTIAGLYLVFNADTYLRNSDQIKVWQIAKNLNLGNYSDFDKGAYLSIYPFQIGMVTFERLIAHFSTNVTFFYFVNLIFNVVTIIILWLISIEVYKNKIIQDFTVIIASLFAPILFNTLFVYGNVYGYTFLISAVYFQLLSLKNKGKKKILYSFFVVILLSLAYLSKLNLEIGIVAVAIIYLLNTINNKYYIIMVCTTLLIIPVVNKSLESYYKFKVGDNFSLSKGVPKSAYLVMGLSENDGKIGWYNGYTDVTLSKKEYNTKKTDIQARKDLKRRLNYLNNHKSYTRKIFVEKTISTWTDSTYQSIWNGPLPTWGGKINTDIMRIIYVKDGESKLYKFIRYGSVLIVWTIFLFSITCTLLYLIGKLSINENYLLYAVIFFIGGFLFHTFWETKAQYVYQYTASLIPVASVGLYKIIDFIWNKIGKLKHK